LVDGWFCADVHALRLTRLLLTIVRIIRHGIPRSSFNIIVIDHE
jgi:hypothetical protein